MMVGQLPSLEEIYDLSSQDLRRTLSEISHNLSGGKIEQTLREKYEEYVEMITTELEERKTLEFFQELCAIDNPYLKKVTDFNEQFLKLASEAIAAKENTSHHDNKSMNVMEQQSRKEGKTHQTTENEANDGLSVASSNATKSIFTQKTTSKFAPTEADERNSHIQNEKRASRDESKKLGIGNKSKMKNSMKEFIMSTLSKNKAQGCYVVKKSGNMPPKPQPNYTVNERGHLVSAQTHEPMTNKSIKSSASASEKKTAQPPANPSIKNIAQPANKISEAEMARRRQDAHQKLKAIKNDGKKDSKPLTNKGLVDMIRQQEKQRDRKQKKKEDEKQRMAAEDVKIEKVDKSQSVAPMQKIKQKDKMEEKKQSEQQIKEIIDVYEQPIPHEIVSKQQQIKQEIVIAIDQQNHIKGQKKHEQVIKKENFNNEKTQLRPSIEAQKISIRQQEERDKNYNQLNAESSNNNNDEKVSQKVYKAELDELAEIKKELSKGQNLIDERFIEIPILSKPTPVDFGTIVDVPPTQPTPQQIQSDPLPPKKCYNQDYWINIRLEAENQIRRFKQEKQLEQYSKQQLKNNIDKIIADQPTTSEQRYESEAEILDKKQQKIEPIEEDDFVQKRSKQLKKLVNDHNKRKTSKRPPLLLAAPQKPLHSIPTFNYLQIYPTFNHIFSVMYTKPQNQALPDIPLIMRDLINMFTSHLQHFKEKSSYFQPAIFLPFDSGSNMQMTDPRQLLLHAQNTHVNLKKIMERLEIFNANLHGQFNSNDNRYYRVIKTRQQVYDIISTGFLRRKGWKQLPHGCSLRSSWNLFWSWSKPDIDINKLLVWQRINHFPFNKNLSRKDLLYKNLDAFRKMLKIPLNFLPLTYNLPKEFTQFSIKFHEEEISNRDRNYWIMKPIGKSRGRGIKVINNLAELSYTDNIVVQKYIANPLLLDGYKFDMRIYVLVTNFHPLEAFVYKQGFARLSTEKYSLDPMFIKNTFVHLTNFAINKNNQEAKQSANFSGGSKISLKSLRDKLTKMNYSFSDIWAQVHDIIVKSLIGCSVWVPAFPTAFELFGYDIMIDTDGGCHLIEINASPSLERSYMLDEIVKQSLIDDILDIIDPPDFDKEQLLDVLSERLTGKKKITPEDDLIAIARILKYKKIRKIGEVPENLGLFEVLAPCKLSIDLQKQIKGKSGVNNLRNID